MSTNRTNSRKGGALLAVLWLSAGLAAIGFSVSTFVRSETDRVSTSADGLRAHYLAQGAVERGILWMTWGYGGMGGDRPDGTPRFWRPNQSRMIMSFRSGDAIVEVIPETARLNVNTANLEDLVHVAQTVTGDANQARQIAEAIVDWRTPSLEATPLDSYYLALGPTFRPRRASIQEIEELLLVRGISPETFYGNFVSDADGRLYARGGLRDCLSVWGSANGPFDVNTANPALMEAFGTPSDTARAIVARRQRQPFVTMQEVQEIAGQTPRLIVGGGISMYTLRATARLKKQDGSYSETLRTAGATIKLYNPRRSQVPVEIVRWYNDFWSQAIAPPFPGMPVPGGNAIGQPGFVAPPALGTPTL